MSSFTLGRRNSACAFNASSMLLVAARALFFRVNNDQRPVKLPCGLGATRPTHHVFSVKITTRVAA